MDRRIFQCGVLMLRTAIEHEKMKIEQRKLRKKLWTRRWILRRDQLGASTNLIRELADEDPRSYRNILRMDEDTFNILLTLVGPHIQKQNTTMRMAIPASSKLELTLRFLATGDSFQSLAYLFRIPPSSISQFLPDVLAVIVEALSEYMQVPSTEEEWKQIGKEFHRRWNFPRCCGAIDGKHVQIKKPFNSGSEFYNYKGTYSVILFAAVDANYCFCYVDIGGNGRASDSAIFRDSTLNIALENNAINFPDDHVFVGDDAFPLRENLMKPFSRIKSSEKETIFNYRLSRARRIVENAFGILAWRFRIFSKPIETKSTTVDQIIWAACTLHNWLRKTIPSAYVPNVAVDKEDLNNADIIPGLWREFRGGLLDIQQLGSNNYTRAAENVRQQYADYFYEEGAVPWQWKAIGIHDDD